MGLSSKQVVSDVGDVVSDWSHLPPPPTTAQQQQAATTPQKRQAAPADPAPPALRCPRCDSTNTKFCYYNNYSRSQPRYLCKACRRHWTSGGTLRNVPVGGSRKNKRPRTTASTATAATNASSANASNNASSPSSSSILLQTAPTIHGGIDSVVQAPLIPYTTLLDVPELEYLNGGGIAGTGVCGSGANLAHLFALPPLSIPFSTASLGSFLDLASSCSGGDAPLSNIAAVSPFFPFVGQPEASTGAAPVNDATSSAWHTSTSTGLLQPISADASSSPNVPSPPPGTTGAAGSCGGMMTASWVDDFAGLISPMQQQQDYHLF